MPFSLTRVQLGSFAEWKPVFDEHQLTRENYGCVAEQVFRSQSDPDEAVILLEWESLERAREFFDSDTLKHSMERGGVKRLVENLLLDQVERHDLTELPPNAA